jgi:hypothetical protein
MSHQFFQQCSGLPEVGGVKPLSEPAIDRCQQFASFVAPAPVMSQTSEAHGRAQLQRLGLLTTGNVEGLVEAGFCLHVMIERAHEQ